MALKEGEAKKKPLKRENGAIERNFRGGGKMKA